MKLDSVSETAAETYVYKHLISSHVSSNYHKLVANP